jgi:hypothetical protein
LPDLRSSSKPVPRSVELVQRQPNLLQDIALCLQVSSGPQRLLCMLPTDSPQCPGSMTSDIGLLVLAQDVGQRRHKAPCSAVACHDSSIPYKPASLGSLQRASPQRHYRRARLQSKQSLQVRWVQERPRLEGRVFLGARKAQVPGTNLLADVATEKPVSDHRSQISGGGALEFDRQIGYASPGVQCSVGENTPGGTGIHAAPARSAAIMLERLIGGQVQFEQHLRKQ